jgi:hypothetical protein
MSKNRKDKIEKSALVKGAVICIVVAAISFSLIPGLAAQGTGDTVNVNVTVNAPKYVEGTFNASLDVDSVADFNSGQFDLAFDSSVVNVTDVVAGSLNGEAIPVSDWERLDNDTIRVILDVPWVTGVNGSGNLATIRFTVVGKAGAKSVLDISDGLLVNTEAEAIPAEWIDDEVSVGPIPVKVSVNAPEYVGEKETFDVTIDVEGITDFNSGMFDLTFDHKVVEVDEVTDGSIDDTEIPVAMWADMDSDTIRVMLELPETNTASGSGYLAEITFKVKGDAGEESALEIADGELVKYVFEDEMATPEAIEVNWNGAVVKIGKL